MFFIECTSGSLQWNVLSKSRVHEDQWSKEIEMDWELKLLKRTGVEKRACKTRCQHLRLDKSERAKEIKIFN